MIFSKNIYSVLSTLGWTLWFSVVVAIIPGAIWLFMGIFVDGAIWFMALSWSVKIPVYLVAGLFLQYYFRYKYKKT